MAVDFNELCNWVWKINPDLVLVEDAPDIEYDYVMPVYEGAYSPAFHEVYLNPDTPHENQEVIVVHEFLHAITQYENEELIQLLTNKWRTRNEREADH
jgi:Zn-dependent peptidase ImmA (M78 family)